VLVPQLSAHRVELLQHKCPPQHRQPWRIPGQPGFRFSSERHAKEFGINREAGELGFPFSDEPMKNLFAHLPDNLAEEVTDILVQNQSVRIERILSHGQASPIGFWYDQPEAEWLVVLQGEAKLLFADQPSPVHLRAGDSLSIPAHQKHRVEWTTPDEITIWLAIFFSG
jgi:cupin 2 domain-containing protein